MFEKTIPFIMMVAVVSLFGAIIAGLFDFPSVFIWLAAASMTAFAILGVFVIWVETFR